MTYLGREGLLQLQRTSPEPVVAPQSAVNIGNNYVTVDYDDWFLGEEVSLIHTNGTLQGFIYRDTLDRIYFHTTRDGALTNTAATRKSFNGVSISKPVVLAANINATQLTTLTTFQATLTTLSGERRLRGWPTTWDTFKSQASTNPWNIQGQLKQWSLSRSAPEIDTGSLGDKFSSFVKSSISGSGNLDFIVAVYSRENYNDVDPLLRLVQLTEQGSTAQAKFYIKKQSTSTGVALYFSTSLIITNCSVDVSASDLVAGSATFVTTGPIRLLSE